MKVMEKIIRTLKQIGKKKKKKLDHDNINWRLEANIGGKKKKESSTIKLKNYKSVNFKTLGSLDFYK